MVRSASIAGFAQLARAVGLDPARLVRQVGLTLHSLTTPDNLIPACKTYRLLELAAASAGMPDFGLMLAGNRSLSHLGALGLLVRDEPDVRRGLQRIAANMQLHSSCVDLQLREDGGYAVVELNVLADGEPVIGQAVEAGVGLLHQILVALLGPGWRPIEVQLVHAAGGSTRSHRGFFGCPVHFAAQRNALVLHSRDLDRSVPGSDRGFHAYTRAVLPSSVAVGRKASTDRVRHAVLQIMAQGNCTSEAVAERLGMHRRTLHRHLRDAGVDFTTLLDAMRMELARQYLVAQVLNMTEISALLGFNAPSSFTRWFSQRAGVSPTAWRRVQGVAAGGRNRVPGGSGGPPGIANADN